VIVDVGVTVGVTVGVDVLVGVKVTVGVGVSVANSALSGLLGPASQTMSRITPLRINKPATRYTTLMLLRWRRLR